MNSIVNKYKFYDQENYQQLFGGEQTWPGVRSANILDIDPSLYYFVFNLLLQKGHNLNIYDEIIMYAHKRLDKDKNKDFIHVDPTDTALIYLSETNINSGTVFYRNVPDSDKPQLIGDVKFIQSNCVFFNKGVPHSGFGHYGDNLTDSRTTINIFMKY